MANRERTNNARQHTTQKTKDLTTRIPHKSEGAGVISVVRKGEQIVQGL
jgi:hypothetical protein